MGPGLTVRLWCVEKNNINHSQCKQLKMINWSSFYPPVSSHHIPVWSIHNRSQIITHLQLPLSAPAVPGKLIGLWWVRSCWVQLAADQTRLRCYLVFVSCFVDSQPGQPGRARPDANYPPLPNDWISAYQVISGTRCPLAHHYRLQLFFRKISTKRRSIIQVNGPAQFNKQREDNVVRCDGGARQGKY